MPSYKGFVGHGASRFHGFQNRDFSGFRSVPTTVFLAGRSEKTTSNSLERFFLAKAVRNLKCMMLLQLLNSAGWTDSRVFTTILKIAISMMF